MKLVIDIPKEVYKCARDGQLDLVQTTFICGSVSNGTPLPEHHGRLIDADLYRKEMLDSREFNFFKTLDMQPTIIEADAEE